MKLMKKLIATIAVLAAAGGTIFYLAKNDKIPFLSDTDDDDDDFDFEFDEDMDDDFDEELDDLFDDFNDDAAVIIRTEEAPAEEAPAKEEAPAEE